MQDELAAHLPPIQGNAGRLQQVFLNLFLNAKDAMPDGGTLKIATSNGDGVSVAVSDTGSGIAQEHIQRIYDPFFTTKSAARRARSAEPGLDSRSPTELFRSMQARFASKAHPSKAPLSISISR